MALCVVIHAGGLAGVLAKLRSWRGAAASSYWRATGLFVALAVWVVFLHLLEISVWALHYFTIDAFTDPQAAFYFSAVTYTTTGYGDLVLPEEWRLVGGIEALTGILMCGWSTGFFFAVVSRLHDQAPVAPLARGAGETTRA